MLEPVLNQAPFSKREDIRKLEEIYNELGKLSGWYTHTCDICKRRNQQCWINIQTLQSRCRACIAVERFKMRGVRDALNVPIQV